VVSVFARSITGDLAGLVKRLDKNLARNEEKKLAAFVVYLTDDVKQAKKDLAELAKTRGIEKVPLTVYEGVEGPEAYQLGKDSDVTVVLWRGQEIQSSHAYAKGKLDKEAAKGVMRELRQMLAKGN
jgi:hypothetical protein